MNETATAEPVASVTAGWSPHDYTSPGLAVVRLDASFPHMRPGDPLHHPWKYLRRDVPHLWYADERYPLMGFLNRDEATLLHNLALQFAGKRALEVGSWLGWSTCHLALAGVALDVIDPAHDDPEIRASVEESLDRCGVRERVQLHRGRSPETITALQQTWSLFFIDGDHESPAPLRDTIAALSYAANDCGFVFHDLAAPAVAEALRFLREKGFNTIVYQTAQIMAFAWRGNVAPVPHIPDPEVAWQIPEHLRDLCGRNVRTQTYRELRHQHYSGETLRPSVCIVTSELIGPFKNGGVGTATTGLAESLAADGLPVTVLYTGTIWQPHIDLAPWKKHYATRGIDLRWLSLGDMKALAGPLRECGFGTPWLVYRWLIEHHFDVIHFNDCCGEGSAALAAKRTGLAFRDSLLVVGLHSPSRWVFELNHTLPASRTAAAFDFSERVSVAAADVLWSPSRYLLDWISQHGFTLPKNTFVQPYAIPRNESSSRARGKSAPLREVVFFGRLEERKGLRMFCNALDQLRDELARRGMTVTFLGKPEQCAGLPSLEYIERRAESWPFALKTLTDCGQPEALSYLREGGRLAVMASPADNSPCTVYEALGEQIPFIAARTGGIPALIAEEDRDHVLFEPSAEGLATALRRAIDGALPIAKPAVAQEEIRASWRRMHQHWTTFVEPCDEPTARLSFAAVIEHRAGDSLNRTRMSLSQLPNLYRYVVLNRSSSRQSDQIDLQRADHDSILSEILKITEDAVLFIHSGVCADSRALDSMLRALQRTGIDGLAPAAMSGSRIVPSLGGSGPFSLYEGATFTGALLVRRDLLIRAIEGRTLILDAPFLGLTDFCVTSSESIWPYPDPVIRQPLQKFALESSAAARVAAYNECTADDRYYMLASGFDSRRRKTPPTRLRRAALAATDLGLASLVRAASWFRRRFLMR